MEEAHFTVSMVIAPPRVDASMDVIINWRSYFPLPLKILPAVLLLQRTPAL